MWWRTQVSGSSREGGGGGSERTREVPVPRSHVSGAVVVRQLLRVHRLAKICCESCLLGQDFGDEVGIRAGEVVSLFLIGQQIEEARVLLGAHHAAAAVVSQAEGRGVIREPRLRRCCVSQEALPRLVGLGAHTGGSSTPIPKVGRVASPRSGDVSGICVQPAVSFGAACGRVRARLEVKAVAAASVGGAACLASLQISHIAHPVVGLPRPTVRAGTTAVTWQRWTRRCGRRRRARWRLVAAWPLCGGGRALI